MKAIVKHFDHKKGWGVVRAEKVPHDLFVRQNNIRGEGFMTLLAGDEVEIELGKNPQGTVVTSGGVALSEELRGMAPEKILEALRGRKGARGRVEPVRKIVLPKKPSLTLVSEKAKTAPPPQAGVKRNVRRDFRSLEELYAYLKAFLAECPGAAQLNGAERSSPEGNDLIFVWIEARSQWYALKSHTKRTAIEKFVALFETTEDKNAILVPARDDVPHPSLILVGGARASGWYCMKPMRLPGDLPETGPHAAVEERQAA